LRNITIFLQQCKGFGYKEVVDCLKGNIAKEEMIEKIKMETRRYAKRQITWFKKNKETYWLDATKPIEQNIDNILNLI